MRKGSKRRFVITAMLSIVLLGVSQLYAQNLSSILSPASPSDNNKEFQVDPVGDPANNTTNISEENRPTADVNNVESVDTSAAPAIVSEKEIQPIPNDAANFDDSKYTLGVNDVVEITVARHPEVSKQYLINSEGKIQYEFVGDIEIGGLTKKEARDLIAKRLETYIVSPEVTVKIMGYNSKVVYIIGEVGAPGRIYMRGDTITIREALLQAGLPLLSASTRKCRLITPTDSGKAKQKYVDVFALLYEGDLRQNFVMKPGDTLYIPATIMAKAMRVIQPVAQPVTTAIGAARPAMTGGF